MIWGAGNRSGRAVVAGGLLLLALPYVASGCGESSIPRPPPAPPPASRAAVLPPAPASPPSPAPQTDVVERDVDEGGRLQEVPLSCAGGVMYGVVPRSWQLERTPSDSCAARFRIAGPNGAQAWVVVHCGPPGRVGLSELDAWYGMMRGPDGRPLPEQGQGRASIGSVCALRDVGIEASGTLAAPLPCVPLEPPAAGLAFRRTALEAPGATWLFDLVGRPDVLEAELHGTAGRVRWSSSIAADYGALIASMRARAAPGENSPYARPCP